MHSVNKNRYKTRLMNKDYFMQSICFTLLTSTLATKPV
ncbi:hypothetical protein M096_3648 [Parabacteroides distasonis str. 3999B T(B) 6]|nr:hypothetical protein M096_3648 [Parabacteroides distasonis str. 3999B T(B) 6]